jgi:hypothetical protein
MSNTFAAPRRTIGSGPSRLWYLLAVVAFIAGFVGMGTVILNSLASLGDDLVQIVVPGERELALDAGSHTIFHERQSTVDGRIFNVENIAGLGVSLTSAAGDPIALSPATAGTYQFGGRRGSAALQFEIEEPGQFLDGSRVVVDAQVDVPVVVAAVPPARLDHQQRRRLLAATIASLQLGRVEGLEQPPGQRPGGGLERLGHGRHHSVGGHDVALAREPLAEDRRGELEDKLRGASFEVERTIYWGFPFYSPLARTLQNRMTSTASYGLARRALAHAMYELFRLNSSRRGALLIVLARPAGQA